MQAWIDSESEGQIKSLTLIDLESPCTPVMSVSTRHSFGNFLSTPESRKSSLSSYDRSSNGSNKKFSQLNSSARRSSIELSPCEDFYKSFDIKPSEFSLEVIRQDRIRLDEKREIRAFVDSSSLNVSDLQSLKDADPETFESLRRNGYKRENQKSTRVCELF